MTVFIEILSDRDSSLNPNCISYIEAIAAKSSCVYPENLTSTPLNFLLAKMLILKGLSF